VDEGLERGELRLDPELDGVAVRPRILEPLDPVDLDLELDLLDGGAAQPQRLGAVAALRARRLDLERPRERVRVVLERDRPQQRPRVRVDLDEPAPEEARRSGEGAQIPTPS
jgi:hypothetical protein